MINGAIVIYIRNPEAHSYRRQRQLKLHSRRRRLYQHSRTAFCFPTSPFSLISPPGDIQLKH